MILILIAFSTCQGYQPDHFIFVKSKADSTNLGFVQITLLLDKCIEKDTITDIDGAFFLSKDIQGVVIRSTGCYPEYKTFNDLRLESTIYLEESRLLIQSGGMGVDSLLNVKNELMEFQIAEWKKNCK